MKNKLQKGMTFLELLVAMFVLIVGISGVAAMLSNTMSASNSNVSRLQAAYLAGEGVEIVRNIRDNNILNYNGWHNGISPGSWEVVYDSMTLSGVDPANPNFLKIDNNGFYNYDVGSDSTFKRVVDININGDVLEITSRVFWQEKGVDQELEVISHLYNWR